MFKRKFSLLISISFFIFLSSCNSDDDGTAPSSSENFDRQTLLINWTDNLIVPIFEDLNNRLNELKTAKNAFLADVNQTNLDELRVKWIEAYKIYQHAEMFNVGKAEDLNYQFLMNIYPTNLTDIENNIAAGNYDLTIPNNNDAVGFPALDYLLYGLAASDSLLLNFYSTRSGASNRKQYLSDIVEQMSSLTSQVLNDWKGGFKTEFIGKFGNTATSSVNLMSNDFVFYYEKLFRANKFGIPAGVFSANPLPDRVEAFYRIDLSKELANESFKAIRNFFNGKSYLSENDGIGFDDYLIFLNSIRNGVSLNQLINNQFNTIQIKINELNNNFYSEVLNNNTKMLNAYDEIQKGVVLLKVDMLQAFDINVDFVDADGD